MIKSRKMVWASQVACMEEKRDAYKVLVRKPEVRYQWEDLDIEGRITVK
jgi:hypothetical protein